MIHRLRNIIESQDGATAVEYALIVALIVLAIMGSMSLVADRTMSMWAHVANEVTSH